MRTLGSTSIHALHDGRALLPRGSRNPTEHRVAVVNVRCLRDENDSTIPAISTLLVTDTTALALMLVRDVRRCRAAVTS